MPKLSEMDAQPTAWPGFWPGTVVSDEDPDKAGALRVRVPQLYGDPETESEFVADGDLPWARAGFAITGVKTGAVHVPPVGATVWVSFFGGNPEKPIWFGGWLVPDNAPDELKSSYSPGPKTVIVHTAGDHILELRWKKDEEHVYLKTAGGSIIDLIDADALDGPKINIETPESYKVVLDEKAKKVTVATPAQTVLIDDSTTPKKVEITTPGDVHVSAGGDLKFDVSGKWTSTVTGDVMGTFSAMLKLLVSAAFELTAATAKMTAATIDLVGTCTLGLGAKKKLVNELGLLKFNTHTHPVVPGVTLVPSVPMIVGVDTTTDTTAS